MCARLICVKIDLNNKPQSVQKKAHELKVLKTTRLEVSGGIQNYAESLSMMQIGLNSSFHVLSLIKIWSVDHKNALKYTNQADEEVSTTKSLCNIFGTPCRRKVKGV